MDVLPRQIGVNLETGNVGVFPRWVGEGHEASCHGLVGRQRRALIGKRQRDPPWTAETRPDLHNGHSRVDATPLIGDSKNEGSVVVAFGENPSPRRMVEGQSPRMIQDELEPALVLGSKDDQ
jgi:hypothetical protein